MKRKRKREKKRKRVLFLNMFQKYVRLKFAFILPPFYNKNYFFKLFFLWNDSVFWCVSTWKEFNFSSAAPVAAAAKFMQIDRTFFQHCILLTITFQLDFQCFYWLSLENIKPNFRFARSELCNSGKNWFLSISVGFSNRNRPSLSSIILPARCIYSISYFIICFVRFCRNFRQLSIRQAFSLKFQFVSTLVIAIDEEYLIFKIIYVHVFFSFIRMTSAVVYEFHEMIYTKHRRNVTM